MLLKVALTTMRTSNHHGHPNHSIQLALLLVLLCVSIPCHAGSRKNRWKEKQSWDNYFQSAKVEGCFLLYDLQKDEYSYYNLRRINTGFLPVSTFKIFNSLVALETKAVRDEHEVLKWDGVERTVPAWNQD